MPRRSRDRLRRLAFLTPSCGGLRADREEKRVTRGSGLRREPPREPDATAIRYVTEDIHAERSPTPR